jgi:hypothetical protein
VIKVNAIQPNAGLPKEKDIVGVYIAPESISDISPPHYDMCRLHYGFSWSMVSGTKYYYGFYDSVQDREVKVDSYYREFLNKVGLDG